MTKIVLRDEPDFVQVIMKTYANGSIELSVHHKYAKDEVIYLPLDAVKIMKENI